MSKNIIKNAMTVDVEDYFQVSAFEKIISRDQWNNIEPRIERNTNKILKLFSDADVKATFFTLGWVAERFPGLVKNIVNEGHELASHGYSHVRVIHQTPQQFREDIKKTKSMLEDLGGVEVKGYRAASYSINTSNIWALGVIEDEGYKYSSSIYPIKHDLYGIPDAPRFAYYPNRKEGLIEVPVSTIKIGNKKLPCGGGGYFRLYPYIFSKWAIKQVNKKDKQSSIFYFHPWEIDPNQPKQNGVSLKTRFRHYLNLNRMEIRLKRLLQDFEWDRMDHIFLENKD